MKHADFEKLAGLMMSRVAVPSRRASPVDDHQLIVGFDTEWIPGTRDLLSVQLATMVHGQVVAEVFDAPRPRTTKAELMETLRWFLGKYGVAVEPWRGSRRVTFVGHNTGADLGVFQDPHADFEISRLGRGHLVTGDHVHPIDGPWKIWLLDLFAYFSKKLEDIGAAIGWPKIPIDISRIHLIKKEDPQLFWRYARRDAEIALVAFLHLRYMLLTRWGVDPLNFGTPAAIGGEIFRSHFFRTAAAPFRTTHEQGARKRQDGTWRDSRRAIRTFDGDLAVRDLAIRTLHGGRNESFIRGFYPHPVVERDVRSMYPHAAKCMGLPNCTTRWESVGELAGVQGREGFALLRFAFPSATERPCLPVRLASDKLFFPLRGESYCTFAEVRLAIRMGATIEIAKAFGFVPGPAELDHELGRYLSALLAEKNAAERGTINYQFYKDLLNQPLGKLGQKVTGSTALDIEHLGRKHGLSGVTAVLAQRPDLAGDLRASVDVGALWMPEQLGLILGMARALIGDILSVSRALSVSTDAVIIDAGASVECQALDMLRAVGSDMPVEVAGDALFIGRARQYTILRRTDRLPADARVIARDSQLAVVKSARLGSAETPEEFAETVLGCLAAGSNVAPARLVTRELKPEEAARRGVAIGTSVTTERTTGFNWDSKRVLDDRDCNPFRSFTTTRPYETKGRREGAEHAVLVRSGEARRRSRILSGEQRQAVIAMLATGRSLRAIAREMKVAASTVAAIRDRARGSGAPDAGKTGGSP